MCTLAWQVSALAEAVVGYSLYCDKMDLMAPLVEHIANKHVSVGVTREQYPVVGKILLEAMEVHYLCCTFYRIRQLS